MPSAPRGGPDGRSSQSDREESLTPEDATWIITNSFMIFTMQTGFSLLESGSVRKKNEMNIMMKNVADVVLGGLIYWMVGYGLSFGQGPWTTPFCGVGSFVVDASRDMLGTVFTNFVFQLSFATTSTTIVSGAVAERFRFLAYCIFSLCNILVYCIPAGWMWAKHGFLNSLGAVDIAGSGGVHLVGGISALVAANMVGPREGRYDHGTDPLPLASPTNALFGLFVLWWGWLSFNCGSVYGISNHKWKYAARAMSFLSPQPKGLGLGSSVIVIIVLFVANRAGVITIMGSFGGGTISMFYSYLTRAGKFDVSVIINGILSSLAAVTGGCALYRPWEALLIGSFSSMATCLFPSFMDRLHIDDPVGAVAVHAVGGTVGLLAVSLFANPQLVATWPHLKPGLFKGGSTAFVGVQTLAVICLSVWSAIATFVLLYVINRFLPIRMTFDEEVVGADLLEHNIRHEAMVPPPTSAPGDPPRSPTSRRRNERETVEEAAKPIRFTLIEKVRRCFRTRVAPVT